MDMNGARDKSKECRLYYEISDTFGQLTLDPTCFLKAQPEKINAIKELIRLTYCACIDSDINKSPDVLTELVLDDMDDEQIWQQLEIRNNLVGKALVDNSAQLLALKLDDLGIELEDDENSTSADEAEEHGDSGDADNKSEAEYEEKPKNKSARKIRKSMVDDQFFKLAEMKLFLEQEDAKEMHKQKNRGRTLNDSTEEIDYFAEDFGVGADSSDEEAVNIDYKKYYGLDDEGTQSNAKDYFNESKSDNNDKAANEGTEDESAVESESGNEAAANEDEINNDQISDRNVMEPASNSNSDNESEDNDINDEHEEIQEPAPKSSNELREARLMQRIRDYEEEVLGEKPWQMKGEVQAGSRPINSLLEEILEFKSTTRPTAPLTEEDNVTIEDLIKQRIRDKAWDDVVPKVRSMPTPQEYRKQLVLDQEKSKQSLAQIYEQQYQQELDKVDPNRNAEESSKPEPKEHQEIKRDLRALFHKLDALVNFHFTPKPVAPEIKIVTNTPAVEMEEVAPVAMSDAKLLAPEEIYRGPKNALLGKSERTKTDKNRERRKKKQKQRAIHSALERREKERAKQGKAPTQHEANAKLLKTITKSRNVEKITNSGDQSALKSSKAFFSKLQDTSATVGNAGSKRPKKSTEKVNAKKLKL